MFEGRVFVLTIVCAALIFLSLLVEPAPVSIAIIAIVSYAVARMILGVIKQQGHYRPKPRETARERRRRRHLP